MKIPWNMQYFLLTAGIFLSLHALFTFFSKLNFYTVFLSMIREENIKHLIDIL